jgi:hypothetical protein
MPLSGAITINKTLLPLHLFFFGAQRCPERTGIFSSIREEAALPYLTGEFSGVL